MTEPTPPSGDEPVEGRADELDTAFELVHASIDGELTAEEEQAVQPDERWRSRVEGARAERDTVQAALVVGPVDETLREDHLAAALAEFDSRARVAPIAIVPPSTAQHPAPPPPGAVPGDQLAARRVARDWVRKLPVGIAAAVLAAIVVIGATQMRGDDEADTLASAPVDDSADRESATNSDLGATFDEAERAPSAAADDGMLSYTLSSDPDSLDGFADAVTRTGRGGDEMPRDAHPTNRPELDSSCSKQDVVELIGSSNPDDLTLVEGAVEGRDLVGVIDRTDLTQVTIIDLDRCEVVSD